VDSEKMKRAQKDEEKNIAAKKKQEESKTKYEGVKTGQGEERGGRQRLH
jgi:hypothetical protein